MESFLLGSMSKKFVDEAKVELFRTESDQKGRKWRKPTYSISVKTRNFAKKDDIVFSYGNLVYNKDAVLFSKAFESFNGERDEGCTGTFHTIPFKGYDRVVKKFKVTLNELFGSKNLLLFYDSKEKDVFRLYLKDSDINLTLVLGVCTRPWWNELALPEHAFKKFLMPLYKTIYFVKYARNQLKSMSSVKTPFQFFDLVGTNAKFQKKYEQLPFYVVLDPNVEHFAIFDGSTVVNALNYNLKDQRFITRDVVETFRKRLYCFGEKALSRLFVRNLLYVPDNRTKKGFRELTYLILGDYFKSKYVKKGRIRELKDTLMNILKNEETKESKKVGYRII